MNLKLIYLTAIAALMPGPGVAARRAPATLELSNDSITLRWQKNSDGWRLSAVSAFGLSASPSTGPDVILYSQEQPDCTPLPSSEFGGNEDFPGQQYRYVMPSWHEATSAVALNRAGRAIAYTPTEVKKNSSDSLTLTYFGELFDITETWRLNGREANVSITLTANRRGWYSIPTPSVAIADPSNLEFALIPGVLHGHSIGSDFEHDYAYGWNIPSLPVIFRERSTSTLTSMLTTRNGLTIAVTAEPGTAAEPWGDTGRNTGAWRLGLSAMNRAGELSPTLYHPVLGFDDSLMEAGQTHTFRFRITFGNSGWWPMFNHVAENVYKFGESLALRHNKRSLSERLNNIHRYVVNDSTSRWHTITHRGDTIGAQEYLGGVYMAKKDAMKNADYGAMWMLGAMTGDSLLTSCRLPYALNFKLKQHNDSAGFLCGASRGQYFLRNTDRFVEEWGPYTEPIATTYYQLMDLGNIALFEPDNINVRELIRQSADWLMATQKADGSWAVAYSDADLSEAFTDLKDYRPTFYGLLVAYRILGESKYLDGAIRGAEWLIENAVIPGRWLGVCGDTRFAPDFATAQAAQALLELHDATGDSRYRDAAITAARFYTTSVYTNPIASTRAVNVKGKERRQWEITTSGLSYEHGGIIGSTNLHGPILLASHAGMFVRIYRMTGERIFLDMARAAAIGRDAFVDDATSVASYYWAAMDRGAGPYPHHAWWQMGWITDYLMAELELRSNGAISFPAGFITPKVGPHRTYAFSRGSVYGEDAELIMRQGLVRANNPDVEVILARSGGNLLVMLMNDVDSRINTTIDISGHGSREIALAPYGLELIKIPFEQ